MARCRATWLAAAVVVVACASPNATPRREALPEPLPETLRAASPPTAFAIPGHASTSRPHGPSHESSTGLSIDINVPAFRLDVRADDSVRTYRVAVGQRRYPTPRGDFRVREIVWNPWWIPPPSEWARKEHATPPGPGNPMGRVKIGFAPLVYMHGTPFEPSLGSAASHACVRMANADAIALARLVHRYVTPELSDAALDSLVADPNRTRGFAVPPVVPVVVRYDVAEVIRDSLRIYPDVYGLGRVARAEALRALAAVGADTARVDAVALGALLRAGRRHATAAALSTLVPRTAAGAGVP